MLMDAFRLSSMTEEVFRTMVQNRQLASENAPDVAIDFIYVIRATGQALIPCCVECRLQRRERQCPIAGMVVDAMDVMKPGRKEVVLKDSLSWRRDRLPEAGVEVEVARSLVYQIFIYLDLLFFFHATIYYNRL
jgi:hypothetical protein